MRMLHDQTPGRRPGFTLIEMLVVIFIIVLVSALVVGLMPRVQDRQKVPQGAGRVQSTLQVAKALALRDRSPRGVRLLVDPADRHVRDLQYIELPADLHEGTLIRPGGNGVRITGFDLSGGLSDPSLWPVQPGDYLQISGGTIHRIAGVIPPGRITTAENIPPGFFPTFYTIMRSPRPLAGEEILHLPKDVAIDLGRSIILPEQLPTGNSNYDILFAPWGAVLRQGTSTGKIILWVRDVTKDADAPGDQTLITVYTRTGVIAAHPVDLTSGNPYSFTQDPRSSGL